MSQIRIWIPASLAVAAIALVGTPSSAQPVASAACTRDTPATIDGQHKCLGAGEYCKLSAERQYERYGYECSRRYDPPRLRRKQAELAGNSLDSRTFS
jgi:hypothetical protein